MPDDNIVQSQQPTGPNVDSTLNLPDFGTSAPPISQAQPQQQAPRMGTRPNFMNLLDALTGKGTVGQPSGPSVNGQPARPVSRLDAFESFLGNFLQSMSAGMSVHPGPGANMRAAAAGIQAPYQRDVQQFELQQRTQAQQAAIQSEQARTAQTEQQTRMLGQSVPLTLPNGQQIYIPASQVGQYLGQYYKGAGAAQINAQSRMSVEQMKAQLMTGQVSKIVPAKDAQGNMVMRALNKYGQPIGDIDGALPPAAYLPKTSSTVEYKQMDDGTIVALPKSTTSEPNIPGVTPKAGGAGGGGTRVQNGVVTLNGQPVVGKGATTSPTRTMGCVKSYRNRRPMTNAMGICTRPQRQRRTAPRTL